MSNMGDTAMSSMVSSVEERENSVDTTDVFVEKKAGKCGLFGCYPDCMQRFASAKSLLCCLSLAVFAQGVLVNGLVNVVITTIERRFALSSSTTGIIASSYDIASLLTLIPVSYLGGARQRARWLAAGVAMVGLGSVLFSAPHFLVGPYEPVSRTSPLCRNHSSNVSVDSDPGCSDSNSTSKLYIFFIIGQLLHGAGSAPLYTLGTAFLDDSVKPKMSSLYVGVYYTFSMLGPACGFLLGGELLRIYIDFEKPVPRLESSDANWLGAWWIGFVIVGFLTMLISIPILMFPNELPHSDLYKKERMLAKRSNSEQADTEGYVAGLGSSLSEFGRSFRRLLKNRPFWLLNLAASSDAFVVMGSATYGPKFLQSQFRYSASTAALIMGVATVPMGAGGTFFGGYLVKRFRLNVKGITRFCLGCSVFGFLCSFAFMVRCPDVEFVDHRTDHPSNLTYCHDFCHCSPATYDPVCSVDGITQFSSPCEAGCLNEDFTDCICVPPRNVLQFSSVARREMCPADCSPLQYIFIAVFALLILFTFLASIPGVSATLRCVGESQRSFAMGLQWVAVRTLGSVPGPLTFGIAIDSACSQWQSPVCAGGVKGSCLAYNNQKLSNIVLLIAVVTKGLTALFFLGTERTVNAVVTGAP